jgi:uncharacterized protein YjbI with pentapeptide repeats
MTELLLHEGLLTSKVNAPVRQIARASTLTAIHQLNGDRKGLLLEFLFKSNLVTRSSIDPIINLGGANLRDAQLLFTDLRYANLSTTDLRDADLRDASLHYARNLTNQQLAYAESLVGATMPDGTVMTEEAWEEFKKRYRQ